MKKTISLFVLPLLALTLQAQGPRGGPGFGGGRGMGMGPRATVTGAPYSAVEVSQFQQVLANGNVISRSEQSKVYRDTQGRTRVERTITPPASSGQQPFTQIAIVDPVAGYRYMLNSSTMKAFQMPLPKGVGTGGTPPARPARPGRALPTSVSLGTQTVNGVTATGTQTTETIAAGTIGNAQPIQIGRISWVSNDLKVPVQVKTTDPRTGTTDVELTNISLAAPDASLFMVPSSYTIVTGGHGPGGMGGMMRGQQRPGGPVQQ